MDKRAHGQGKLGLESKNNLHSSPAVQKSLHLMWVCFYSGGGWDSQGWSSSMTSSMQLAQECLKDPPEASEEPPAQLEGLEMFAQTIETGESKLCVTASTYRHQNLHSINNTSHDSIGGNISPNGKHGLSTHS